MNKSTGTAGTNTTNTSVNKTVTLLTVSVRLRSHDLEKVAVGDERHLGVLAKDHQPVGVFIVDF